MYQRFKTTYLLDEQSLLLTRKHSREDKEYSPLRVEEHLLIEEKL